MGATGIAGYPYRAKAWINHMGNPLYGIAGLRNTLYEDLCDPEKLPLIICVDAFINETTALADYIVPDTVTYESWGTSAPWANRKSTRLNSSHVAISYAVFCLKKKNKKEEKTQ